MLRGFRRGDIPAYLKLLLENFPAEGRLIGFRPEPMVKIIRKLFRPDLRLLLGLLRLLGRPVFTILVVEAEGRLAASSLVTYNARSAYLSAVVTDPAYRRRGFARLMLHAAYERAARGRRPYVALDVLAANTPARRLYDAEGFVVLRHAAFYTVEIAPTPPPTGAGVRPLAKADLPALAAIANARLSQEQREVLPVRARDLALSPWVAYGLASASEAWVLEEGGAPVGFVRATVGAATESANLTQPILDARATPAGAEALVRTALAWVRAHGGARAIAEASSENADAIRALVAAGFVEADAIDTLYRRARA